MRGKAGECWAEREGVRSWPATGHPSQRYSDVSSGAESLAPRLKLMFPGALSRALTARALGVVTLGVNLPQQSTMYRRTADGKGEGVDRGGLPMPDRAGAQLASSHAELSLLAKVRNIAAGQLSLTTEVRVRDPPSPTPRLMEQPRRPRRRPGAIAVCAASAPYSTSRHRTTTTAAHPCGAAWVVVAHTSPAILTIR